MLIRMICGEPQRTRSEPPAVLTGCYTQNLHPLLLLSLSLSVSLWHVIASLQVSHSSHSYLSSSLIIPQHTRLPEYSAGARALGPWRNQFKWLSVDVIDFHFTRLSWKMHRASSGTSKPRPRHPPSPRPSALRLFTFIPKPRRTLSYRVREPKELETKI